VSGMRQRAADVRFFLRMRWQTSTHESHMYAPFPAMRVLTFVCRLPQKLQLATARSAGPVFV
jgi:hypothetical protein